MNIRHLLAAFGTGLLLSGCGGSKAVSTGEPRPDHDLRPLGSAELLARLLQDQPQPPRYYSAKADVSWTTPQENRTLKAHVRVVRDSAAWLSITPALGIEVARILLTADSLHLIDKLHDQYWTGDTAQARKKFGLAPSLGLFQDALLGLPIGIDPEEKYRNDREDGRYTLSTKERRKYLRAAEEIAEDDSTNNGRDMRPKRLERTLRKAERKETLVYKYWIDPDSMHTDRVLITDLAHDQQADVRYMERKSVDGHSIPGFIGLSLSAPGTAAGASLRLERIQLNGPLELPFRIPAKFTPME
jgi:hypothetical protein